MSADYLILVGDDAEVDDLTSAAARLPSMRTIYQASRIRVLADQALPHTEVQCGAVLGTIFSTGEATPLSAISADVAADAMASDGEGLLNHIWGGYVAMTISPERGVVSVLRDPSGALPAYMVRRDRAWWIFSRIDVALRAGLVRPQLDWSAVGRMLAYPQLRGAQTGLRGISELLPGVRGTFEVGGHRRETLAWSPWLHAARSAEFSCPTAAALAVREAVERSVRGWSAASGSCVLELSGGLDSSIIACSLNPGAKTTLINFHTPTMDGDERRYAEAVALAVGHRFVTELVRPEAVDIRQARPGLHPRPAAQALLQPIDAALAKLGADERVGTYFSGLGGDNVFCALPTAGPAADALRAFGLGTHFFTAFDDLCRRHEATAWRALSLTLRKAFRPMPLLGMAPVFSYLTAHAPEDPPAHPWLNPPGDILPGKREHVASILVAMGFLDRYAHADQAPVRFPLLTQPVLEACLRVPTWMANAGGRNRAVARDAFKDRLPSEVFHRQSKGGLTGFMGQAFEANRSSLADQLVRGWLVTAELVDRSAVEASLAKPAPNALEMARLLYLADVEAWARTWPIKSAAPA